MADDPTLPRGNRWSTTLSSSAPGPAGLAAAIRLKSFDPEISLLWLWKRAPTVGAHILSGAVIDPIGLDRLRPTGAPIRMPAQNSGHRRSILLSDSKRQHAVAQLGDAEIDGQPRQFIGSLGAITRWLGARAKASASRSIPGSQRPNFFSATKAKLSASRPATWASAGTVIRKPDSPAGWS